VVSAEDCCGITSWRLISASRTKKVLTKTRRRGFSKILLNEILKQLIELENLRDGSKNLEGGRMKYSWTGEK